MAEELTRSLTMLAQRGVPRGATAVLEEARRDADPHGAGSHLDRLGRRQPVWVAAAAFAATLVVIGGTLVVSMVVARSELDVGAVSQAVRDAATTPSGGWLWVPAIAGAVAVGALVVSKLRKRKEKHMTTTKARTTKGEAVEKPVAPTKRTFLWLILGVVAALAVVGAVALMGGDSVSTPTVTFDGAAATYEGPASVVREVSGVSEDGSFWATLVNEGENAAYFTVSATGPDFPGFEAHRAWLENEWTPGTPPPGVLQVNAMQYLQPGESREWLISLSGDLLVFDVFEETTEQAFTAGLLTVEP